MNNELMGGLHRRDFMKLGAMGVGGVSASGWMNVLAGHAAETQAKHKSCILLYMSGGPSHKDTFDLKPDSDGAGEFKPIATNVSGIQISEHFPKFSKWMHKSALLRGMSTGTKSSCANCTFACVTSTSPKPNPGLIHWPAVHRGVLRNRPPAMRGGGAQQLRAKSL